MKIIKAASGKSKIKMSKSEWEAIGKTAGWASEYEDLDTGSPYDDPNFQAGSVEYEEPKEKTKEDKLYDMIIKLNRDARGLRQRGSISKEPLDLIANFFIEAMELMKEKDN